MSDTQDLSLFAKELQTQATKILVRAASTDDSEAKVAMCEVAASYERLAKRAERLIREAEMGVAAMPII